MAFKVGMKVTLIAPHNWRDGIDKETNPVFGAVYTIREIDVHPRYGAGLRFEEIRNPLLDYAEGTKEVAFDAREFRPVVERKTDISVLTALLNPANHKKLEDVS